MDLQSVWIIAGVSWILTVLSGIAHQVIREVSWHELEEYCQQKRSDKFGEIFELRERISLGTLLLLTVSAGFAVSCTAVSYTHLTLPTKA